MLYLEVGNLSLMMLGTLNLTNFFQFPLGRNDQRNDRYSILNVVAEVLQNWALSYILMIYIKLPKTLKVDEWYLK